MNVALNSVVPDWKKIVASAAEWPFLLVLDHVPPLPYGNSSSSSYLCMFLKEGRLLGSQGTGPLERFERYDGDTLLSFIARWAAFLHGGGLVPPPEPLTELLEDDPNTNSWYEGDDDDDDHL